MKPIISFEDFARLDLRVGTITTAEVVPDSAKLVKLEVELGIELGKRQIIAGIQKAYSPENLVGKQIVIVANLESRKLAGLESQGMLLAAQAEDGSPILLQPDKSAPAGSVVS